MNLKDFVAKLNNREYPFSLSEDEKEIAKQEGFVVVYGASDDLIELDGAIDGEEGCYEGAKFLIDSEGLLPEWENIDRDNEGEVAAYIARKSKAKHTLIALWDSNGYSWQYMLDIPYETFEVIEDGGKYCRGIVFELKELK